MGIGASAQSLEVNAGAWSGWFKSSFTYRCWEMRTTEIKATIFADIFFLTNSEDHPSPWDSSQEKRREVTSSGSAHIL